MVLFTKKTADGIVARYNPIPELKQHADDQERLVSKHINAINHEIAVHEKELEILINRRKDAEAEWGKAQAYAKTFASVFPA